MACDYCDDEIQSVADSEALVDFVTALLAGDVPLARIMAGRAFGNDDARAVDNALARAASARAPS
ncbi:MAG: hypothetical protein ABW128_11320 [Rhizorhabdus sp.]